MRFYDSLRKQLVKILVIVIKIDIISDIPLFINYIYK